MDYFEVSSLTSKISAALYAFKPAQVMCLVCQVERKRIPAKIEITVTDGEIKPELVGAHFIEDGWVDLYDEAFDGADVKASICRDCAVRRGLKRDPEEIPVAVSTTPAEMAVVPAAAHPGEESHQS